MKYRKIKRKWKNSSKNKKMMILFVLILSIITVGYASLSQVLKITGYASIDKGDGMIFTSIGIKENRGAIVERDTSIKAKTLVNTQIGFQGTGSITFQASAQNQGTTDAKLIEIKGLEGSNTKEPTCIQVSVQDHNIGDFVYPNQIKNFTITITSTCTSYSSKELDLHFLYEKQETINGSLPTLGNAVEYLKNNKVSIDINTSPTNGLFAIGDSGELTTSTSPREYRYIGTNPDNYIQFNNELWRIIGIFDGQLKIIRNDLLENMAWSDDNTNNWSLKPMQTYLNGDYLNSIDSDDRIKIDNYTWKLGGASSFELTTQMFYDAERGEVVQSNNPTEWTGKIALLYPSDYGFSTSGGSTTNRNSCLATHLYDWSWSVSDCKNNSWLYDSSNDQWTLTHSISLFFAPDLGVTFSYLLHSAGGIRIINLYESVGARPVLYLKFDVEFNRGSGTSNDPYILE